MVANLRSRIKPDLPGHFARERGGSLPFTRFRLIGFAFTLALLLATGASLALRGLDLGLDMTGGTLLEVRSDSVIDAGTLRARLLAQGVEGAGVQLADDGHSALLRIPPEAGRAADTATDPVERVLTPDMKIVSEAHVGSKVSAEVFRDGLTASLAAVAAIGIYIWLRFDAKFGVAAFLTTLHDVILILGLFSVTGMSFDLTSIAAMLAIAGYSINDTVIVFDRVREVLGKCRHLSVEAAIDRAITGTLSRTLMTSGTTLAATVSLMIFGGPVLFGFAAAVTFGIVIGTYSSIFVAAPLLIHIPGQLPGRAPETGAPVDQL
ncbi:protein translocase subunit SecF [Sulfitobacter sp. LCG007]